MTIGTTNLSSYWVQLSPGKLGQCHFMERCCHHQSPLSVESELGWMGHLDSPERSRRSTFLPSLTIYTQNMLVAHVFVSYSL